MIGLLWWLLKHDIRGHELGWTLLGMYCCTCDEHREWPR